METVQTNGAAILTIDELKARMEADRAELARRADAKRDEAAALVRNAQKALADAINEAQRLEEEAEALDGNVRPKLVGVEVPKPKRSRKVKAAEAALEPAAEPKPSRASKTKPARTPRPDGTVSATVALVKKALKDLGGKANKSSIRAKGDFTRATLDEVLKKDDFVITGRGKGAGTQYKVA